MGQFDAHSARFSDPASDTFAPNQRPAFDSNRRWYDEYVEMMRRANFLVIDNVHLLRHIDTLHQALVTVLDEIDGGSFLSAQTRDHVQELVKKNTAGVATALRMYQQW